MHHQRILELYREPKFFKSIDGATHKGNATNQYCGDEITIIARVSNGVIDCICYEGSACSVCLAGAELVCQKLKNLPLSELKNITEDWILSEFEIGKEDKRTKCALLSLEAIEAFVKI